MRSASRQEILDLISSNFVVEHLGINMFDDNYCSAPVPFIGEPRISLTFCDPSKVSLPMFIEVEGPEERLLIPIEVKLGRKICAC